MLTTVQWRQFPHPVKNSPWLNDGSTYIFLLYEGMKVIHIHLKPFFELGFWSFPGFPSCRAGEWRWATVPSQPYNHEGKQLTPCTMLQSKFLLAYINYTKGFHCDIPCIHIMYFYQIHPLYYSFVSLPFIFKTILMNFHYSLVYMHIKCFDYIHLPPISLFTLFLLLDFLPPTVPFSHSCNLFFRYRKKTCDIYVSESGLLCLTVWSTVPSIFLQTT
jgi:hypothetical protein